MTDSSLRYEIGHYHKIGRYVKIGRHATDGRLMLFTDRCYSQIDDGLMLFNRSMLFEDRRYSQPDAAHRNRD